jgi:inositol transport system ATP-binding protein
MSEIPPLLELRGIEKSFPGVWALKHMAFSVCRGSVHVICGENGAGKSTLVKIINGIYQPDNGEILLNGERVVIPNPVKARQYKISMISQELNYIPEMTVEQSLFLGDEPLNKIGGIDWKKIRKSTIELLKREGLSYKPDTKLKDLSISDIQMLEILKAVSHESNIIIMDEPTSAITDKEVVLLFSKIAQLKAKGAGIIYISHRLDELLRIADEISVIRDGALVETRHAKDFDIDTIIQLMVGRALDNVFPPKTKRTVGETVLDVEGLSNGSKFTDINFQLRAGEIVGFAGLMGAGRTDVVRALFGLDPFSAGVVRVHGKKVKIRNVQDSISLGIAMLSEDRKRYGIIAIRSVRENVGLSCLKRFFRGGYLHKKLEKKLIASICDRMRVKTPSLETAVDALSGGTQQKVVFAKWMLRDPDILILDEPTRGIDVGAKYEIYKIMLELAGDGKGVLMISSELPELIGVCDRIYVMSKGRITGELSADEFDQERIMKYATMGTNH